MDPIHTQEPQTLDIRDYLRPIWRRLWLILIVVFVATALTYRHYSGQPKTYRASTTLYLQGSPLAAVLETPDVGDPSRYDEDESTLIPTPAVAQVAARLLRFRGNANALLAGTTAAPVSGSDFIEIETASTSPVQAVAVANAFAQAFISLQSSQIGQQARQALAADQQTLTGQAGSEQPSTVQQIHTLQAIGSHPSAGITQIRPASGAVESSSSPSKKAEFAFFISLLFCIGLAYGLERLDRRLHSVEDIQVAYGHAVVGEIFRETQPAPMLDGRPALPDQLRESFRTLRTNLDLACLDKPLKTILITSALPDEGKSTVVRNLALAYREAGQRVAVIEGDLRNPTLERLFGVDPPVGLAGLLSGQEPLARALQEVPVYLPGLSAPAKARVGRGGSSVTDVDAFDDPGTLAIVGSGIGTHDDPSVLMSNRLAGVIDAVAADYDVVLIDTPGLLSVSDAVPLIPTVDGMLIVSRLGKTTRQAARQLTSYVERIPGANVLGVVANVVPRSGRTYGAYD